MRAPASRVPRPRPRPAVPEPARSCAPLVCLCVPVVLLCRFRVNDTSEITSVPIRASQAEICYWAPYSLCGTKAVRKVFKSA
ncbi:hypothetical protein GT044_16430 [Streptomyces sp. SID335]|nr:hypothetical protein [Streptomyces sp. SID335]MYZ15709.1 hypothetical protein [Streptomyces sp. SID337]